MIPLKDTKTSSRFPFWTIAIIALCCYIFFLQISSPDIETFLLQFGLIPQLVAIDNPHSLLPFISAVFLHGGILHLGLNMLFLWVFGDNVEEKMGLWFPVFFIIGGVSGNVLQYIVDPNSAIPVVGASGAIAAVLGAYWLLFPHHQVKTLVPIFIFPAIFTIPASVLLTLWFAMQLISGFSSINSMGGESGVAYFAHIGGFAVGWLIAVLLIPRPVKVEQM